MSTPSRPTGSGAARPESGVARPVTANPAGDPARAKPADTPAERPDDNRTEKPTEQKRAPVPPWQRGPVSGSPRVGGNLDAPTAQMARPVLDPDMPDLSATPPASGRGASGARAATTTREREAGERREAARNNERRPIASVQTTRKGPRRASLQVKQLDPWSVLKLSLVLSFALFLVWMVAVGVLYLVLDGMGVWDRLNSTFTDFVSVNDPNSRSSPLIGPGRVFGVAAIVGAVNIVLMTALATISSFLYNLTSDLVGGVELTLTERD